MLPTPRKLLNHDIYIFFQAGEKVAKLYGVDAADLYKCITKPKIKVGTEFVAKGMNVNQCNYSVGAMAKALFDRLFKWLVTKCNETLATGQKRASFIGVLDIAGFEIFEVNTLIYAPPTTINPFMCLKSLSLSPLQRNYFIKDNPYF